MNSNADFNPRMVEILEILEEARDIKTFRFVPEGWPGHSPGQFLQLWVPGVGEFPVSIASPPSDAPLLEVTVKRVGRTTGELFRLRRGDFVGIRGPFGRAFPVDMAKGKGVNLIGGGIGLPALMSFLREALKIRKSFEKLTLCYGARAPDDLIYWEELKGLREAVVVHVTVDIGNENWVGPVGVVTELCEEKKIDIKNHIAFICGPLPMMHHTVEKLLELGFPAEHIYLSLEQHMECGVGKCGHCRIGPYYLCTDGPVFPLPVLLRIQERYAGKVL